MRGNVKRGEYLTHKKVEQRLQRFLSTPTWIPHHHLVVQSDHLHNLLDNHLALAEYDIDLVKSVRFLALLT
jgi:hypothetical protein